MNILENRVKAQNVMVDYINQVIPVLRERFEGKVTYKKAMSPIKPYYIEFNKLLGTPPPKVEAHIMWNEHAVSVKFNTTYQKSEYLSEHIREVVYIYDHNEKKVCDFEPLESISIETIEHAQVELARLLDLQERVNVEIRKQQNILSK